VFADLDVLCVPSFEEPFGLVVIEGMAMRRAVVAYSSGALPEIVTAGVDGLLVAPQDVDGLADALVQALDDAELRRRLGEAGRQTVLARFAATRQADEVLAIYRRVCGMATE
jgi:glycosyltransferase involved in cell wall biosynthesis